MNGKQKYQALGENNFHIFVAEAPVTPLHGHDFLEFSYIAQGIMEHEIDGHTSVLRAGDYFIVDYGTQHAYRSITAEPLVVVNLLFYPEFLDRTLAGRRRFEDVINSYLLRFSYKTLRSSPTGKTFHDENGHIRAAVEEVCEEYGRKEYGYIEFIRCRFVELLILTMRKIGRGKDAPGRSAQITEITEYVKEHYTQSIRLVDMARKYNYSISYLSRKFTAEIGMGFSEYVQRIRIEHSCRLLEQTDLRVSDIALLVGYENQKFFNKVFKTVLGITPREFRNSKKT